MGVYTLGNLNVSQARLDGLMADFSGLENLDNIVNDVLVRLKGKATGMRIAFAAGTVTKESFDGYFAELIRVELGRTLGVLRAKAVQKAQSAGAGSASVAVLRRMYKSGEAGNINIAGGNRRISSRTRVVQEPTGGKSGIRRVRTVKPRTKQLREYYGPDRGFILRILNSGRDVFMATPDGATGKRSKATYGKRGAMGAKGFFHTMTGDMEQAARQLGDTLVDRVETWVNEQFTEGAQ